MYIYTHTYRVLKCCCDKCQTLKSFYIVRCIQMLYSCTVLCDINHTLNLCCVVSYISKTCCVQNSIVWVYITLYMTAYSRAPPAWIVDVDNNVYIFLIVKRFLSCNVVLEKDPRCEVFFPYTGLEGWTVGRLWPQYKS